MTFAPNLKSYLGDSTKAVTPVCAPGDELQLTKSDGTALDAAVLPSSAGTWILTAPANVKVLRQIALGLEYDGNAATTTGYPLVVPYVCARDNGISAATPAISDDCWRQLTVTDGTVSATALGGTAATGLVEAHGPLNGIQVHRGLVIQPEAVTANSGKLRKSYILNVAPYHWIMFEVAEQGDTTNRGKLRLFINGVA